MWCSVFEVRSTEENIINSILKILYPRRCLICSALLHEYESGFCRLCVVEAPVIREERCSVCSKPVNEGRVICHDCMSHKHIFIEGFALWNYNAVAERIIARMKYHFERDGISFLSCEIVYHSIMKLQCWGVQALVPVPLHKSKMRKRGFNQASVLAKIGRASCRERVLRLV